MSQGAVEKAIGKLLTDESFRERFFKDPASASFYAGLELSREELSALSRVPKKALSHLSQRLDGRICRLAPDGNRGPAAAKVCNPAERERPSVGPRDAFGAAQCVPKGRAGSDPKPLMQTGGLTDSRKNLAETGPAMNTTGHPTKKEK